MHLEDIAYMTRALADFVRHNDMAILEDRIDWLAEKAGLTAKPADRRPIPSLVSSHRDACR
jgi:hypothetical protein